MSSRWVYGRIHAVLTGYRLRYGEWPIEVRLSPIAFDVLRGCFDEAGWCGLASRLRVVRLADRGTRVLTATDGVDKRYDYWVDGAGYRRSVPDPEEWLGVVPSFPHESRPDADPGAAADGAAR